MINNAYIELIDTKTYYGFPVAVYKFKKHDDLKGKLLERVTIDSMSNGTYTRSVPDAKPILDYTNNHAIFELRTAYQKAYDHFYSDILDCDLSFDHGDKPYKTRSVSKPVITQSWFVRVPPNKNVESEHGPMTVHTHFLSLVCGSYYLNLDQGEGGNLVFTMPECDGMQMTMFRECLRPKKVKYHQVHEINEGEIVLWAGVLPHTIEKQHNVKSERVSIITNSAVSPLCDSSRTYNYNVSAFDANGEYYTDK